MVKVKDQVHTCVLGRDLSDVMSKSGSTLQICSGKISESLLFSFISRLHSPLGGIGTQDLFFK